MMAIGAVVFALAAFQGPSMSPDFRDAVLTEKDAVFLLEPEVVAGPGVSLLKWSPDGTYLLVQRHRLIGPHPFVTMSKGKVPERMPDGESQFLIYGAASHKTVPGLKLPLGTHIDRVEWVPGSSKAVILAQVATTNEAGVRSEPVQTAFLISASGEARTLAQAGENELIDLQVSPHRPYFALLRTGFQPGPPPKRNQIVQFFDGEGKPAGKVPLAEMANQMLWTPDGKSFALLGKVVDRKVTWEWFRLNPAQGTAEKMTEVPPKNATSTPPPHVSREEVAGDLMVQSGKVPAGRPEFAPVPAVFLMNRAESKEKAPKEGSFAYVSTDAELGSISPNGSSVAYVHKGVAMVRPLARVPKQLYIELKNAAERTLAVSNAKQAALALIMYASDYDDNLMASGGNWREQVMPYIKNEGILNSFNYTFGGGNMAAIDKPAETEIGYVDGPGGRAVAYADGHVKWIPNK